MGRVFNFSAGPAMVPEEVLKQAAEEMLDWQGSGMCVMEMSHRDKEFMSIAAQAEKDLRELMSIPANYKVMFLQGGASSQFAMVPINLLRGKKKADYFLTGAWSEKAIQEAARYCEVNTVCSSKATNYNHVPAASDWKFSPDAAYVHYVSNETIHGVEFPVVPDVGNIPLVVDMSSTILSRPVDVSKFGVIYAGAQKNIGPAGLTVAIVREDLIGQTLPGMPVMFDYKIHADNESMYNTPPTYSWYIAGLVFQWMKRKGGLAAIGEMNQAKAKTLYSAIDGSAGFYKNPVAYGDRSWMNVPFTLVDAKLDDAFLKEAKKAGLVSLKGHRSIGGMRASIYNAMPQSGVDALVSFMKDFAKRNG